MKNSLRQKELEEQASVLRQTKFQGNIIEIVKETVQIKQYPPYDWDIVIHPGGVTILPVHDDGRVVLIQQWRRAIQKVIYELPAGLLNPGEALLEGAKRELEEEVGYRAAEWSSLGGFYAAPGFCTEYIHLFLAKGMLPGTLGRDIHEAIDVVEMTLPEALALIDKNAIEDAKTIAGLLKYSRLVGRDAH